VKGPRATLDTAMLTAVVEAARRTLDCYQRREGHQLEAMLARAAEAARDLRRVVPACGLRSDGPDGPRYLEPRLMALLPYRRSPHRARLSFRSGANCARHQPRHRESSATIRSLRVALSGRDCAISSQLWTATLIEDRPRTWVSPGARSPSTLTAASLQRLIQARRK
jgi:hypothetical protein